MCESVDIGFPCISDSKYKYKLQQLNNIHEELADLEQEVDLAQKSFKDYIFESTACIYCLKLKMVQCTKKALDFKKDKSDDLKKLSSMSVNEPEEINIIQKQLHTNISKKSLSIKRSLMKLSNLLGQHELLSLPYYELMAYSKQLRANQISNASNEVESSSEKLSYSKALQHLEQILEDVERVEAKTLVLVETRDDSYFVDDPCSLIDEDYKACPPSSTATQQVLTK